MPYFCLQQECRNELTALYTGGYRFGWCELEETRALRLAANPPLLNRSRYRCGHLNMPTVDEIALLTLTRLTLQAIGYISPV